jgi:hypothetical protein
VRSMSAGSSRHGWKFLGSGHLRKASLFLSGRSELCLLIDVEYWVCREEYLNDWSDMNLMAVRSPFLVFKLSVLESMEHLLILS